MEKKHRVDGRLPHDLEERLINWKSELEYLKETNPPRYYGGDIDETKTKLHILADAFIQGYGSVSYIRKVNKDTCNIVFTIRKSCLAHLRFIIKKSCLAHLILKDSQTRTPSCSKKSAAQSKINAIM